MGDSGLTSPMQDFHLNLRSFLPEPYAQRLFTTNGRAQESKRAALCPESLQDRAAAPFLVNTSLHTLRKPLAMFAAFC